MNKEKLKALAWLPLLGLSLGAAMFVLGQAPAPGGAEKKKKEPPPINRAPYEVWTMQQLANPQYLGNYVEPHQECSVQRRNPGAAPESHPNFAHILIFTSGEGDVNLGGEIVTGPDGKKIVQGGERRKIVIGDVYHMAINMPHWVLPNPNSSITYFVCNLYTD